MLLTNVDDIIHGRTIESSRIEYKEGWNPERVIHTICAFANDIDNIGGGYIVIGVADENGSPAFPIVGIDRDSIDRINKELMEICNLIEPRYIPSVSHEVVDGKDILIIEAVTGPSRPYKCPISLSKDKTKRAGKSYYIRRLSSTIVADPTDERMLFEVSSNTPYDCRVNMSAELSDIRPSLIYEYLSKTNPAECEEAVTLPIETVCKNLKVLGPPPNDSRPINAGILFFNERPGNFIEGARIELVDMPDPTGEGMTEYVFDGPLDLQVEGAVEHIRTHAIRVLVSKEPDTPVARRVISYPLAAVEEAISNAVYHKDYSVAEPVTVTVRPDRIEVLSIPGPDMSISDEDLRNNTLASTRYRNARIGDLLKHRGLAEKRGTGVPTMVRSLRENGSDPPVFDTDATRSYMRVTIPIHEAFLSNASSRENGSVRRTREELEGLILEALRDSGAMSVRELADELGYSRNAPNLYDAIRSLIERGRIEYTLPDRMSSRNQRIRLRL